MQALLVGVFLAEVTQEALGSVLPWIQRLQWSFSILQVEKTHKTESEVEGTFIKHSRSCCLIRNKFLYQPKWTVLTEKRVNRTEQVQCIKHPKKCIKTIKSHPQGPWVYPKQMWLKTMRVQKAHGSSLHWSLRYVYLNLSPSMPKCKTIISDCWHPFSED